MLWQRALVLSSLNLRKTVPTGEIWDRFECVVNLLESLIFLTLKCPKFWSAGDAIKEFDSSYQDLKNNCQTVHPVTSDEVDAQVAMMMSKMSFAV